MQKLYRTWIFVWCIFFTFLSSLHASQYGPNTLFQAPYESDEYIGNFTGTFCAGKTDQSYDRSGNVVPFLQNYGKEDILLGFIDPLTHDDPLKKIGVMDFSGSVQFECLNLSYYKNIMHHMFLGLGTIVQNLTIYIHESDLELLQPLTPDEKPLFALFESKIPKQLNTSGILSTYLETGYNRTFTELKSVHELQLFLRGAILTPQWMEGADLNLLEYPFTGNMTFGYQVIGTVAAQLTKHMSFGVFGTVNSFQSKVIDAPDNEHIPNNQLFIDKKIRAQYTPGTVYNGVVYWQLNNFNRNFTIMAGLSFMYGTPRKIKPLNPNSLYVVSELQTTLRVNATLESWNLNALFLELDYNFLTKENPQGPCISLFFNTPLSGYHYPKINGIGGEFGLTFNYYI